MIEPDRAVRVARQRAAEMRDGGAYVGAPGPAREAVGPPGSDQLLEWALIEPDQRELRSSRRLGAPITVLRRALVGLLRPYQASQLGEQSRFNVQVALRMRRLEARVEELEHQLSGR